MLYSQWLALPLHIRAMIAHKFGIAKVGPTHVVGNDVVSDGYKIQDVEAVLSSDEMKEYVGVNADPAIFISLLAAKIVEPEAEPVFAENIEAPKKKPAKVKKTKK